MTRECTHTSSLILLHWHHLPYISVWINTKICKNCMKNIGLTWWYRYSVQYYNDLIANEWIFVAIIHLPNWGAQRVTQRKWSCTQMQDRQAANQSSYLSVVTEFQQFYCASAGHWSSWEPYTYTWQRHSMSSHTHEYNLVLLYVPHKHDYKCGVMVVTCNTKLPNCFESIAIQNLWELCLNSAELR